MDLIQQLCRHAVACVLERNELAVVAQRHMRIAACGPRQNRIEHELRTVCELFRLCGNGGISCSAGIGMRPISWPLRLVTKHIVKRKVFGETPVFDIVRNSPAAAELDRTNAGRKHLGIDDLAIALLDQQTGHVAPTKIERQSKANRATPDDQDGNAWISATLLRARIPKTAVTSPRLNGRIRRNGSALCNPKLRRWLPSSRARAAHAINIAEIPIGFHEFAVERRWSRKSFRPSNASVTSSST